MCIYTLDLFTKRTDNFDWVNWLRWMGLKQNLSDISCTKPLFYKGSSQLYVLIFYDLSLSIAAHACKAREATRFGRKIRDIATYNNARQRMKTYKNGYKLVTLFCDTLCQPSLLIIVIFLSFLCQYSTCSIDKT